MPSFQAIVERANQVLNHENLARGTLRQQHFKEGTTLSDAAMRYGAAKKGSKDIAIIDQLPLTIQAALRAMIHANLERCERGKTYGITLAWAPGADYELTIWESPPSRGSKGGITALIKTPVPVPGSGGRADRKR
jgi:hypothetical protein